ncbi:hypothetical protein ACFRFJ_29995 [Streptomyces hydrogenans]|uniref:hypothetical protein n=1 Tax=Streptomyces hydrogenans TaxID=1873719 RepID=UPI0036BADCF1
MTEIERRKQQPERPAIWLRVSRDGGRSYGPQLTVWLTDDRQVPAVSPLVWPPCQCPQHRDDTQEVPQ